MAADGTNRIPGAPRGGPPGSAARSGPPGGGSGGAGRLVQWKGKTIQMGGAAEAEAEAAPEVPVEAAATVPIGAPPAFWGRMDSLAEEIAEMHHMLTRLSERDTNNERVFNTLHAELSDYKKDFIYEHLKPVVRPLLFLYDSLEQFEDEIGVYGAGNGQYPGVTPEGTMPTQKVHDNIVYFREQLIEALQICEVTPMEKPSGRFEPRFQKAVQAVNVGPEQDNMIQRVVRCGWFLNGQLLRPADVVVGKHR